MTSRGQKHPKMQHLRSHILHIALVMCSRWLDIVRLVQTSMHVEVPMEYFYYTIVDAVIKHAHYLSSSSHARRVSPYIHTAQCTHTLFRVICDCFSRAELYKTLTASHINKQWHTTQSLNTIKNNWSELKKKLRENGAPVCASVCLNIVHFVTYLTVTVN